MTPLTIQVEALEHVNRNEGKDREEEETGITGTLMYGRENAENNWQQEYGNKMSLT